MTDNFKNYKEFIGLLGGLPETNEKGNLDKYYVIELMRRGKDNPDMPAANYHFKNYYIYSWRDLERYEQEIKDICTLLHLRAYCSVNYKLMSQVALDTLAESARRLAAHDYKKFYAIFESCSGKFIEHGNNLWIVDIDGYPPTEKLQKIRDIIEMCDSGYEKNIVYEMHTRHGLHLITRPFNIKQYERHYSFHFDSVSRPEIKKNHLTLLYENL